MPKQAAFIACPADDVGFGGARGGGKSDGLIGDYISHEEIYGAAAIAMAFRRSRTELVELIERAKQVMLPIGFKFHEQEKYFRGPKGGRLRFTYLESDSDADAYQGHSYTRLYPEEMGTFPNEAPINKLTATLRSGHGVPCQMKGTCNPGGAGHQWVKARYQLGSHPHGMQLFTFEFVNPFTKKKIAKTRIFIPSKVTDNRYLGDDYVANLFQVGSETLVRAWLTGDWSVVEGAFFPEFSPDRHILAPFAVPRDWLRFRSMAWGSARPFSVGWWAVVSDDYPIGGRILPRGAIIRYREWYGASAPNVGLKLSHDEICDGIKELERYDPKMSFGVLDPRCWASEGGPSIAEEYSRRKVYFNKADNKRVPDAGAIGGWDQVRARLKGDEENRPMIYLFETCVDLIRTLPVLQHDKKRPEDVDTESEDHAPDECRYACMSRPYVRVEPDIRKRAPILGVGPHNEVTMNRLFAEGELSGKRRKRI